MGRLSGRCLWVPLVAVLCCLQAVCGIRFVIDREECFSHNVEYEGDIVHASFVVIKSESLWRYGKDGVDLMVKGPTGEQIHGFRVEISKKFEFVARHGGVHRFCFTNQSPYHKTVDFDVHVGHFGFYEEHAKDVHFNPLLQQIENLENALSDIQFVQHWLKAQTDRQSGVNEAMSVGTVKKAVFESGALILASVLQVCLLCRLFYRKLGISRV